MQTTAHERVYVASKTTHAHKWRALRNAGHPISSSWIDEAGEGESGDYAELSERCLQEVREASILVLYCEQGEVLKGAIIEAGAALMAGIPVRQVGNCASLSRVFCKHPLWREYRSVEEALLLEFVPKEA